MHSGDRLLSERIAGNKTWAVRSGAGLAEHRPGAAGWQAASLQAAAVVTRIWL